MERIIRIRLHTAEALNGKEKSRRLGLGKSELKGEREQREH